MYARYLLAVCIFSQLAAPSTMAGEKLSLEECKKLEQQADLLTELRRKGGSNSDMNHWKKERKLAEREFREGKCSRWGYRLKR